jgi:hypothetical protein
MFNKLLIIIFIIFDFHGHVSKGKEQNFEEICFELLNTIVAWTKPMDFEQRHSH